MADANDILEAGDDIPDHKPLVNENPYIFGAMLSSVTSFLGAYGWFILLGSIFAMVLWANISEKVKKFFGHRKRTYDVTDSMTPDQIEARMRSMDKARNRMQERYNAEVRAKAERLKELEEKKRLQKIEDHNALKHGKSQSGTLNKMEIKTDSDSTPTVIKRNKDSKPLRSYDSNPLGGSGGSSRWRPSHNRPSAGG